jgi:hypothetical protein
MYNILHIWALQLYVRCVLLFSTGSCGCATYEYGERCILSYMISYMHADLLMWTTIRCFRNISSMFKSMFGAVCFEPNTAFRNLQKQFAWVCLQFCIFFPIYDFFLRSEGAPCFSTHGSQGNLTVLVCSLQLISARSRAARGYLKSTTEPTRACNATNSIASSYMHINSIISHKKINSIIKFRFTKKLNTFFYFFVVWQLVCSSK